MPTRIPSPLPTSQALGDSEQGFSEDDYIGLFDEVKFPSSPPPTQPNPNAVAAAPAPTPVSAAASPSEKDGLTLG